MYTHTHRRANKKRLDATAAHTHHLDKQKRREIRLSLLKERALRHSSSALAQV